MNVYDTINSLEEISFIAGSDQVLTFNCLAENGLDPLNIGGGPVYWRLCPFGSPTIETLNIAGNITDTDTFTVTLTTADTLSLSGKYIQQIIITDSAGDTFRPSQGTVVIAPAIEP